MLATSLRKKVLVAEGDRQLREAIQTLLTRQGFEVILAHDGREALQKALSENPDAILLDTAMPGMGVTDICAMLKSNQNTRGIPLGVITGDQEENGYKAAQQAGALLLLPRAFKPEQLISSVGLLVGARRKKAA